MLFPVTHSTSATVPPLPEGESYFLEDRFCVFAFGSAQNDRVVWGAGKSLSFRTRETNRKEIWCRVDCLGWYCVHRFWFDPVPIVFGMMLWELALEWSFSYWFLIDECFGFGLMICKLVFNWFMSLIKNKVSSFLKFEAAHFIEPDSSSNLSNHPPVILHVGLAQSCRIHCLTKSKDNLLPWEKVPFNLNKILWKVLFPVPHPPSATAHLSRMARVNCSIMDSATSPSAPRRMTGWEAYSEEWKFSD